MTTQEFERFLILSEKYNQETIGHFEDYEYHTLKNKLTNILFDNQGTKDKIITDLKNNLYLTDILKSSASQSGEILNKIKIIKETLNILEMYDWKFMHSTYRTDEGKQVAIWEQNGDGKIRNHKIWDVKE